MRTNPRKELGGKVRLICYAAMFEGEDDNSGLHTSVVSNNFRKYSARCVKRSPAQITGCLRWTGSDYFLRVWSFFFLSFFCFVRSHCMCWVSSAFPAFMWFPSGVTGFLTLSKNLQIGGLAAQNLFSGKTLHRRCKMTWQVSPHRASLIYTTSLRT